MACEEGGLTVAEFCQANGISRSRFTALCKCGAGPALVKVGTSTRITLAAADDWQKAEAERVVGALSHWAAQASMPAEDGQL